MPNKTIYVSDADLPVYARAQEVAGGNLSRAISEALRRYVEHHDALDGGYEEVTVRVGTGKGRTQRFLGVLLAETQHSGGEGTEHISVYRTRAGRYAVHHERSAVHTWTAGKDGTATGWRKHLSADQQHTTTPASATLTVVDDRDALAPLVPAQMYELVTATDEVPVVEDLDI
ncbi:EXLDI protein [Aquipuribacter sp. SD81]|uniref:EXLDI protein n=1 Tax=Aquipuribacter sp. SD81 TaxID=3127703 RepID=UPI003016D24A